MLAPTELQSPLAQATFLLAQEHEQKNGPCAAGHLYQLALLAEVAYQLHQLRVEGLSVTTYKP